MKHPVALIILDGLGLAPDSPGNAVSRAQTPFLNRLASDFPHCTVSASGEDVGLPAGQMGNSEVGHTNLGAGRIVYQDLTRITRDIRSGAFFENEAVIGVMDACKDAGATLHLFGLVSPGGVHSHSDHLLAFLRMAAARDLKKVMIHCFLDGRDVPPSSAAGYLRELEDACAEIGAGTVATVMGRFYAMDRDKRWDRTARAYNAMVFGEGIREADPVRAVLDSYEHGITDEFVEPVVCTEEGLVREGDGIIFINFRPDRARQITRAFTDPDFDGFERRNGYFPVRFVCATCYDETIPNVEIAWPPDEPDHTLGQIVSENGMTQLRIAETEKYAHVTFFFNGGREDPFPGENRILVPSPKQFPTYDLIPEMSAVEVAEKAAAAAISCEYDLIVLNFANCDMVGHTGVFDAVVKAVETVDRCLEKVVRAVAAAGGVSIVTADHGNAEEMLEEDGVTPHTAHSTNLVPLFMIGRAARLRDGRLCDIAPTILKLMGLPQPQEMTGQPLF